MKGVSGPFEKDGGKPSGPEPVRMGRVFSDGVTDGFSMVLPMMEREMEAGFFEVFGKAANVSSGRPFVTDGEGFSKHMWDPCLTSEGFLSEGGSQKGCLVAALDTNLVDLSVDVAMGGDGRFHTRALGGFPKGPGRVVCKELLAIVERGWNMGPGALFGLSADFPMPSAALMAMGASSPARRMGRGVCVSFCFEVCGSSSEAWLFLPFKGLGKRVERLSDMVSWAWWTDGGEGFLDVSWVEGEGVAHAPVLWGGAGAPKEGALLDLGPCGFWFNGELAATGAIRSEHGMAGMSVRGLEGFGKGLKMAKDGVFSMDVSGCDDKGAGVDASSLPVMLTVELGRAKVGIGQLSRMREGAVITMGKAVGEPFDILAGDKVVARGELVAVNDGYGIRVLEVLLPAAGG